MKNLVWIVLSIVVNVAATAQHCTGLIPANVIHISSGSYAGNLISGQSYWLCGSGEINTHLAANGLIIFMEGNSNLDIAGNNHTIYALGDATINYGGVGSTFYLGDAAHLNLGGSGNVVYAESNDNWTGLGSPFNTINTTFCPTVSIDKTSAGPGGCLTTATFFHLTTSRIELLPESPAQNFTVEGSLSLFQLKVTDLNGILVIDIPSSGSSQLVNMQAQPVGSYFLVAERNGNSNLFLQVMFEN